MTLFTRHLEQLKSATRWTYRASRDSSAESAAWSAIALAAHGETASAVEPAKWLAELQQDDGSVGVFASEAEPRWPTSLATLAWQLVDRATGAQQFARFVERAAHWSLDDRGKTAPRSPQIGHDTTIVGWSWAADTASWLEPTCYHVLGLTAAGFGNHPRVREGRRLIVDRLLPAGGANYGNTVVLGQPLLAHVAPSGVALVALGPQPHQDHRVELTLRFLEESLTAITTPISLSWGCLGLTAHDRRPQAAGQWIEAALANARWQPLAADELALLLLASRERVDWLPWINHAPHEGATV